jgi:hypothetical protein
VRHGVRCRFHVVPSFILGGFRIHVQRASCFGRVCSSLAGREGSDGDDRASKAGGHARENQKRDGKNVPTYVSRYVGKLVRLSRYHTVCTYDPSLAATVPRNFCKLYLSLLFLSQKKRCMFIKPVQTTIYTTHLLTYNNFMTQHQACMTTIIASGRVDG